MGDIVHLEATATDANFSEDGYLSCNPDVKSAIDAGTLSSGRAHFDVFGRAEGRRVRVNADIAPLRAQKKERIEPILKRDIPIKLHDSGVYDALSDELRAQTRIVETDSVSSHNYDPSIVEAIQEIGDGLALDCGAGKRNVYYGNVVNLEIVNYDTTDILAVGESLPFIDDSFDAVFSIAVLEHVRDPFRCAAEIVRVLKPGGILISAIPFLQPVHGYPHHYFNATPQGHRRLYEDTLDIESVEVPLSLHPVSSLSWIVRTWAQALPPHARSQFLDMRVSEFLEHLPELRKRAFSALLPAEAKRTLCSGTLLRARKPI